MKYATSTQKNILFLNFQGMLLKLILNSISQISLLKNFKSTCLCSLLLVSMLFGANPISAQVTYSFPYTGSNQTFVVPQGVTSVTVRIWGAGGGGAGGPSSGGSAAFLKGNLAVTPGQTLALVVGGGGRYSASAASAGTFGGGGASTKAYGASGGGYSGIFNGSVSFANALSIAGGGAGAGYYGNGTFGGAGGATTGSSGGDRTASTFQGGRGATVSAGGAAGVGTTQGTAGTALQGGSGGNGTTYGGSGGGGGYYGGGGGYGSGSTSNYSSGGGGGSSYYTAGLTTVTNTAGTTSASNAVTQAPGNGETGFYVAGVGNGGISTSTNGGNGLITITFTCAASVVPTSITGTTTICTGSTTLTSAGGSLGSDAVDVWYAGSCGSETFTQNWATQPYALTTTTLNASPRYGVQSFTSTGADPNINITGLSITNPTTYKYMNVRFRVTSVTQVGAMEFFWYNSLYGSANGAQYKNQAVTSVQNVWQTVSFDMSATSAGSWAGSTITGFRFDWTTNSAVTMEIDFISLTDIPLLGTDPSLTVSPTVTTTYYTAKKGVCGLTACTSQAVTISCGTPAFTIPSSACVGETINITGGSNLSGVTAVTVNGATASFTNISSSAINIVVPAGAVAGSPGTIAITTGGGTGTSSTNITVNPLATAGTFQYANNSVQSICVGSSISCSNSTNPTNGGAGTLGVVWYCGEYISGAVGPGGTYGNWVGSSAASGVTVSSTLQTAVGSSPFFSLATYNPQTDFAGKTNFVIYRRAYTNNCGIGIGGSYIDQIFYLNLLSPIVNVGGAVTAVCSGQTTAALGGSFSGSATAAVWSDGGAGGTFTNNGGSTPGTTTYTSSTTFATPVTLTLTSSGGSCGTTFLSKSLTINAPAPLPTSVTASPATICVGSSSNLNATFASNSINWYTTPTGGTPFATVASGTAVPVSPATTTIYYAESVYGTTINQTFTASGSYTVPAGVTSLTAYTWGGGGGGGGSWTDAGEYGDGGGGGGGSMKSGTLTVVPAQVYTVTIGAGGAAGSSSGGNGGTGGTTTFTGTGGTISTLGGSGGTGCTTYGGKAGGAGGTGGTYNGGSGASGNSGSSYDQGGGGGGGAGSGAVGGNAPAASDATGGPEGTGGGGTYAGGNGGSHPQGKSSGNAGVAGNAPGGGGSGASDYDSWGYAGGAGARGQVVLFSNPTGCPSSTRVPVTVTVSQLATVSNAGTVPTPTCSNVAVALNGNTPTVSSGLWSVSSGPSTSSAQFSSPTSRTSNFTAAGGAGSYVLAWTITNGACSSSSTTTANVVAIPNQPSIITGNAAPCNPSTQNYIVTNDANVVTYNWTFPSPSSWNTLSGGTTNSINAYVQGASSGNISVTGTNTCGTSSARTFAVVANSTPPVLSGCTNINLNNITNTCGATATWTDPTATDACTTFGANTATYATPGPTGFVVPAGVTSITVRVWGAGGGGGGATGLGSATGGGGGGGGFAERVISVTPGAFYPITVGAGGAGGVAATGTTGGTSLFSSLVVATGGVGGVRGSAIISPTNGTGGAGGNGTAGTTLRLGGAGATGVGGSGGGGGGGSAGTAAVGNAASGITGGAAVAGGGAGATALVAQATAGTPAGVTGGAPGGGGSGYRRGSSILNPDATGGNGGNGQVTVSWTQPGPVLTSALPSGSTFPVGTTAVTYSATDAAGFSSTCSFNVVVADAQAPTIATNPDITTCSATPSLTAPAASDNCSGIGSVTNNAPTSFPVGNTVVVWSVTDAAGNTSTSNQNVLRYAHPTSVVSGNNTICSGASTNVSVALTGTQPWDLTWYDGTTSTNVTGITSSPYLIPITGPIGTKTYTVTALEDANCTANAGDRTGSATITVNPRPTADWDGPTSLCLGVVDTFFVNFTGTAPYTFTYTDGIGSPVTVTNHPSDQYFFLVTAGTLATRNFQVTALTDANCTAQVGDRGGVYPVTVTANCVVTWTGAVSTSWHTAGNWDPNVEPNSCNFDIYIPKQTNQPSISTKNIQVGNVTLESGIVLSIGAARKLSVCKNWTMSSGVHAVVTSGDVILNGTTAQTITGGTIFDKLIVNNSSTGVTNNGNIRLNTGLVLQDGDFTNTYLVTLKSSATGTAYLDNFTYAGTAGTYTGDITSERYNSGTGNGGYSASDFHYLTSPVATSFNDWSEIFSNLAVNGNGQIIPLASCDANSIDWTSPYGAVMQWNEAGPFTYNCSQAGWYVFGQSGTAITKGRGYTTYLKPGQTVSVTGTPTTGNVPVSLTNSGLTPNNPVGPIAATGQNLVGNPYPSPYQWDRLGNNTNIGAVAYAWQATSGYAGTYQPIAVNNTIAVAQGFMVLASTSGTYNFQQNKRQAALNPTFYKNQNGASLVVEVAGNTFRDRTEVAFNDQSSPNFDFDYDGYKMMSKPAQPTLYTGLSTNKMLSINMQPSIAQAPTVPMGMYVGTNGNFNFTFDNIASFDPTTYIFLEDKKTATMQDMRANNSYSFVGDTADAVDRFVIHFTPPMEVTTTDASCTTTGSIKLEQPGTASWTYTLKDNGNNTVSTGTINSNTPSTITAANGVYTLDLVDAAGYSVSQSIQVNGAASIAAAFSSSANSVHTNEAISVTNTTAGASSYTWDFGDGSTPATTATASHSYAAAGTYTVTLYVTNAAGCQSSVTRAVTVSNATGIAEANANTNSMNIFSFDDKVIVDFSKMKTVEATVQIYNLIGQELSNEKHVGASVYTKELNEIDAAYVLVRVKNSNGQMVTKKVFISNSK